MEVKTRTTAQIRSHAQKYVIKLCKKYNIEIKSKRRIKFVSDHLNFPYRRKSKSMTIPVEKISEDDKNFIKNFNFYEKNIDFGKIEDYQKKRKKDLFLVGKIEGTTKYRKHAKATKAEKNKKNYKKLSNLIINEKNHYENLLVPNENFDPKNESCSVFKQLDNNYESLSSNLYYCQPSPHLQASLPRNSSILEENIDFSNISNGLKNFLEKNLFFNYFILSHLTYSKINEDDDVTKELINLLLREH